MNSILIQEKTFEKARNEIRKSKGKIIIFSSNDDGLNRKILEKEKVDIPDGVYLGLDGVVVVSDGILVNTFSQLIDSGGNQIPIDAIKLGELPQPTAKLISIERFQKLTKTEK